MRRRPARANRSRARQVRRALVGIRARRGATLMEVMVVIALLVGLMAVLAPATANLMRLEQRRVARDLSITYELLHDEAVLRNVTFRVAYHLDGNYYQVEVGDASTLIFDDPEARADHEKEQRRKMRRFTEREREEQGIEEPTKFQAVAAKFKTRVDLPRGTRFGRVYTPQYGEWVEPSGDEEDPEEPLVVYSYIFPSGYSENTVVQIVEERNPEEGYTLVVEPLSGKVHLHGELVEYDDLYDFVPQQGPTLMN